jgi:F-type H+-transporting ATPase subunit delta
MVQHVALARQWRVAIVHAARPLNDAEQAELARSLSSMAGGNVDLQVKVDEELLAGVVVYIGDLCLDATARGRLQNLRDSLLQTRPVVFS